MKRIEKFENQQRICNEIETMVSEKQISYMEACTLFASTNLFEIEYIADLVKRNGKIRSRLEEEAEELNFLKKRSRLPI